MGNFDRLGLHAAPEEGEPIVPCAWAKETPAISAATAVSVVNVFII